MHLQFYYTLFDIWSNENSWLIWSPLQPRDKPSFNHTECRRFCSVELHSCREEAQSWWIMRNYRLEFKIFEVFDCCLRITSNSKHFKHLIVVLSYFRSCGQSWRRNIHHLTLEKSRWPLLQRSRVNINPCYNAVGLTCYNVVGLTLTLATMQ